MKGVQVSIVMPVYNEANYLDKTLRSILSQEEVNLELIVVNDGSSDGSLHIIESIANQDDRVILISQSNKGITNALINGCKAATGEFIARQDAGDWSLPGRLKAQLEAFHSQPEAVLCSTGTRYYSERQELLFEATLSPEEANLGLIPNSIEEIKGPSHHGCVMFRREAYEECGGYRPEFLVAQDLDLWTRLMNFGKHICLPEVYYEAVLRENAISSKHKNLQDIARKHIFECMQLRRTIGDDSEYLKQLNEGGLDVSKVTNNTESEHQYFLGSILFNHQPKNSRYYFRKVLRARPWHIKSWLKLIRSYWF